MEIVICTLIFIRTSNELRFRLAGIKHENNNDAFHNRPDHENAGGVFILTAYDHRAVEYKG